MSWGPRRRRWCTGGAKIRRNEPVPVPDYRHRYRTDPEFRAQECKRTRVNHIKNSTSPAYLELTRQRGKRSKYKSSISIHQEAIQRLRRKVGAKDRLIEELELVWGKERADRKRAASGPQDVRPPAPPLSAHG
jgi:hypothetical protein